MTITGTTRVAGVFGRPVRHSLSPVFQNAAFEAAGIDCVYVPMEVEPAGLGRAVAAIRALGFLGVNCTIPHKEAVIPFLDEVAPDAARLGSVNTVRNDGGRLSGFSTDGPGFLRSLRGDGGFDPAGRAVLVAGAGGSAAAIAGALAGAGAARIIVCNRTEARAEALCRRIRERFGFAAIEAAPFVRREDPALWRGVSLAVNTTSVGMAAGDGSALPVAAMEDGTFVYDIVYNRRTGLLAAAAERGLPLLDGLSMLLWQGAVSFEIWTGAPAPLDAMRKALEPYRARREAGA